jgi:hypothetical protein
MILEKIYVAQLSGSIFPYLVLYRWIFACLARMPQGIQRQIAL